MFYYTSKFLLFIIYYISLGFYAFINDKDADDREIVSYYIYMSFLLISGWAIIFVCTFVTSSLA